MAPSLQWVLLAYRTPREPSTDRVAVWRKLRRFIDSDTEFVFIDDPDESPENATPFDTRGAELSHHGGDCSFETMLHRFSLDDPVLWDVARIVHEADLADDRFDALEAPGLDAICRGLSMVLEGPDVVTVLRRCSTACTEYRRRSLVLGRDHPA